MLQPYPVADNQAIDKNALLDIEWLKKLSLVFEIYVEK